MNDQTIKFSKGSEWRKWDLHVHTPASHLNNQFGNDWDKYVQALFKITICKEIAALGITDYFTIDGYKKIREDYLDNPKKLQELFTKEEIEKINKILVVPNVEFRLNKFVGDSSINFHVLFSEDVPAKYIEENFLHDLDFVYEGNPQNTEEKSKLKVSNLEVLGRKLKAEHEEFQSYNDIHVGMMNAVVDDSQISNTLEGSPSKFKGKYLIGLVADEDLSKIDWDSHDHQTRKVLIQKSDFLFSSNAKTREWALGNPPYLQGEGKFIQEFKTLKPCLHGSDAHASNEIGHPCIHRGMKGHNCEKDVEQCDLRHTWIKADPTFEGLKQLLYEPAERVVIQKLDPSPIKSNYTISRINFTDCIINDELSIAKTEIELNPNLVAVTGSKGSGKTALVDLIANCYMDRCNTDDKNSFVRRISDQNPIIKTKLTFKNDKNFEKGLNDQTFFEDSEIVYIAQGELEKYIGDESDLDTYVRNLVFESPQIKDSVKSFEFDNLTENIKDTQSKIKNKNILVEEIEKKTSAKEIQTAQLELKQKEAGFTDIEKRIKELAKSQSEEKVKLVLDKQSKLTEFKERRDDLISLRSLLRNALTFIDEKLPEFSKNITALNALLKKLGVSEEYSDLSYVQRAHIVKRLTLVGEDITKTVSSIEESQKELVKFEASVQEHAKLLGRKRDIELAIKAVKVKINEIKENEELLGKLILERKLIFEELLTTTILLKKKYDEIIGVFSSQKGEILSDLYFNAQINFDPEQFLKNAEDIIDNRKVAVINDEKNKSTFDKLILLYFAIANGDENKISELIDEVEKLNSNLKSKLKGLQTVSVCNFYDFLYGNYMDVVPVVKYKKTDLNKLSLGQKATVLIKIYLAQDDRPIIIDSHDDHLDNEFIMEELVNAIREAKRYRQVILASNNGNVVINSDAEQIIVAKRNDGRISYVSGSIENPKIRDMSLKVLEGGPIAFKKRQQKYRLGS